MTTLSETLPRIDYAPTPRPRIIERNTFRYTRPDGVEVIRLHETDIIERHPDGRVVLNSGGWKTVTTKARLNEHSPYRVWSDRGQWIVGDPQNPDRRTPFFDGMILPDAFSAAKGEKAAAKDAKLAKAIKLFCEKIDLNKPLPAPNGGDCWKCLMFERDQFKPQASGWATTERGDVDHLRSHIKEGYMHGSLIWNALQAVGFAHPEFAFGERPLIGQDRARSAVRRFLRRRLGLVA